MFYKLSDSYGTQFLHPYYLLYLLCAWLSIPKIKRVIVLSRVSFHTMNLPPF